MIARRRLWQAHAAEAAADYFEADFALPAG
jgi:hypothetical protein